MYRLALSILLSLVSSLLAAQTNMTLGASAPSAFDIHFRFDNSKYIKDYHNNQAVAAQFVHYVDSVGIDNIDSIVVVSTSSPEGVYSYNKKLSQRRLRTISQLIQSERPSLLSKTVLKTDDEDWNYLQQLISADTLLSSSHKEQALRIITSSTSMAQRKRQFSHLPFYRYIYRKLYAQTRRSQILVYSRPLQQYLASPQPVAAPPVHAPKSSVQVPCQLAPLPALAAVRVAEPRRTILAVKTNLLYDAVSAVNIAVEVPIGQKWSVEVEDVCPWWHHGNKWAFQLLQVGGEGRYWFHRTDRRDVLSGHFGGVYAMGGKYDFQSHRDACYQGEFWSAGVSYGYSLPIGRHFNMEFGISLGFMQTHYRHYTPSAEYGELVADPYKRGIFNYFGPTKLKVSLVYPFQINCRKKGVRHE